MIPFRESRTVDEILQNLDDFYGNAFTSKVIMRSFYSDHQKEGGNVRTYGSTLEKLVSKALRLAKNDIVARNARLISKFSSRQKYETIRDFPS